MPERHDDFAWENDKVVFRVYGPALRSSAENNGTDCWLKRVSTPVIDKWYSQHLQQGKSYHEDHGEGYDPYHVGASAGCGATAIWLDNKRLPMETFFGYQNVKVTEEQLTFSLIYRHKIGDDWFKERKNIRLKPNQHLYHAESTFWKNGDLATNLPIAIGVTTHEGKAKIEFDPLNKILSGWEVIDGFGLGTAILLGPDSNATPIETHQSTHNDSAGHALWITNTDANGKVSYYAGYGWQKAGDIVDWSTWRDYLQEISANNPYE